MESFKEGISLIESHFYAFDPNFAVGVSSVVAQGEDGCSRLDEGQQCF